MQYKSLIIFVLLLIIVLMASISYASEFRKITPIFSNQRSDDENINAVQIKPVDRSIVEAALQSLIDSWNQLNLEEKLSDEFYDKTLFLDTIQEKVPLDAQLRILSIESIRTINQYLESNSKDQIIIVSTVSALVRTQIEYTDEI